MSSLEFFSFRRRPPSLFGSRELFIANVFLGIVLALGTVGFSLIEGWDWQDSLYMTFITMTTIGLYGKPRNDRSPKRRRMYSMIRIPLVLLIVAIGASPRDSSAQFYLNQGELAELMHECTPELERLPRVRYSYKTLYSSRNNNVLARNTFYKIIGEGDITKGKQRSLLVGLLNRKLMHQTKIGDTLVVPNTWDLDFCAYSPFPRFYAGGLSFDKLFIIDKSIQAWAAYEGGRLARWGIVNTGDSNHRTPNGRFNFNWKTEYRVSSYSPVNEPWEMYWVFNFVESRGIHIHQYPMPSGGPMSHGCVRLVDEDAQWIYRWADGWKKGSNGFRSGHGTIASPGTTILVIGNDPAGNPKTFIADGRIPKLRQSVLPGHPFDIAPGTNQQKYFDRVRGTRP